MIFTPASDASGTNYADFGFQVHDTGSTANGGATVDPTANKITINVLSVSDAPVGADNTFILSEDTTHTFSTADFGFSDPADDDTFASVFISQIPTTGTLNLAGATVNNNQSISVSSINNGNLTFTSAANSHGAPFDTLNFRVNDTGSNTNGGMNQDQTDRKLTFIVESVSDAPQGTDNKLVTTEDTPVVIDGSHFGFSDTSDGDFFAAITVTQLPINGVLTLNGAAISASQVISISNINSGELVFTPAPNQSGLNYADFQFLVHDTGSVSNGGTVVAQSPSTLSFDVLPINDAPQGTDSSITLLEDQLYTLSFSCLLYTSPSPRD